MQGSAAQEDGPEEEEAWRVPGVDDPDGEGAGAGDGAAFQWATTLTMAQTNKNPNSRPTTNVVTAVTTRMVLAEVTCWMGSVGGKMVVAEGRKIKPSLASREKENLRINHGVVRGGVS